MTVTKDPARDIPDPIKRKVRQRCGFGCVVCGNPLIEYHHMNPWSVVKEHKAQNITLLCSLHHGEATGDSPLLPDRKVRQANSNPRNKLTGSSAAHALHFGDEPIKVEVGSSKFESSSGSIIALLMFGERIIWTRRESGVYLFSFQFFNDDGEAALVVLDNEVVFAATNWDVEWVSDRIVVRSALRKIVLVIVFNPTGHRISVLRLNSVYLGARMLLSKGDLILGAEPLEAKLGGQTFEDVNVAIAYGKSNIDYGAVGIEFNSMFVNSDEFIFSKEEMIEMMGGEIPPELEDWFAPDAT